MSADAVEFEADYVIVGAGSAGCVLANRLTADGKTRVLLLEAGGDDRPLHEPSQFISNLMIHIPVGYAKTLKDPKINWLYKTVPDAQGRALSWPRGKVLGGSSSINGLLYVRGQRADYDLWRQLGCEGWSWDDVKPYFLKSQHQERGASDLHATGGPLNVSDVTETHRVSDAALAACQQAGLPLRDDVNDADQEGASYYQLTVKNGRRHSAAVAYLHPAMRRPNLRVVTRALATRVIFDGARATGVAFRRRGIDGVARAKAEVILAGGAVNSPQLLELSGVGAGALLQRHGIAVTADSPGVGENLQDHYVMGAQYRLKPDVVSVNEMSKGLRMAGEVLKYGLTRKGLLTLSAAHIAVFCKSRPDLAGPDIQFHILPATMDLGKLRTEQRMVLEDEPGLTLAPCQLRPESRGAIHIVSPDPATHPAIAPNYLDSATDREVAVAALKWAHRIASRPALATLIAHPKLAPDPARGDQALLDFAIKAGGSIYHAVGTCRMGSDPTSVVDPQLRVRGVTGLRVVDASIMPRLVSGNTNAPTIMIAEKAADMILSA